MEWGAFDTQIIWCTLSFLGMLMVASQNIQADLRGDNETSEKKMEISQTTIFNFLSKKDNKMHYGNLQATLYVDCSNQQNIRS